MLLYKDDVQATLAPVWSRNGIDLTNTIIDLRRDRTSIPLASIAGDAGLAPVYEIDYDAVDENGNRLQEEKWMQRVRSGEFGAPSDDAMITLVCGKNCLSQAQKLKCLGFAAVRFIAHLEVLTGKWSNGENLVKPY